MNKTKSNAFSILLAIVLIALIWIGVVAIAVIFDGEQFELRCILIQPFSIGGVFSTRAVWKYYLQH